MKKQFAAAVMAAALTISMILPAGAAVSPVSEDEASQVVHALGIMVGDKTGMDLSARVTRAQFITMAVKAAPNGAQIGQAAASPYPDVPRGHWASGYVEAGVTAGLISGYTDGTFRPENPITLAEGATIVLKLLGYRDSDFSGVYPTGQLAKYRSLKLDRGVQAAAAGDALTRRDAMFLFYNLMTAKNQAGAAYLQTLGHSLNAAGEIDLVALVNDAMEGPVVARSRWQSSLPVSPAGYAVYRNGQSAALSSVQEGDVVYWNPDMRTLWVYADQITGTVQALEPSGANPTAVTVAGRTCQIGTAAAAYALSDLGSYHLGDTVTLRLGRGGAVAAVEGPGGGTVTTSSTEKIGVVTAADNASYSDGKGGTYQRKTVTLLATDGKSYQYPCTSAPSVGSLARVTLGSDGSVAVNGVRSDGLLGKFSTDGRRLGDTDLADTVEILDVAKKNGVRVYPARMANLRLSGGDVKYYHKNAAGAIDRLILDDITGDAYRYGILTRYDAPENRDGGVYSYAYDLGGQSCALSASPRKFNVELGPVCVKGDPNSPDSLEKLTSARTGTLSGNQFVTGDGERFTLSDNVAVYELRGDDKYTLSTLSRVSGGSYRLTGWYDKTDANGGRLRVLVARGE